MNERWEKNGARTSKGDALDDGFRSALGGLSSPAPGGVPSPQPKTATADGLPTQGTAQIELRQELIVSGFSALRKFVATEEGVVTLENRGDSTLVVLGSAIGRTFVHAWDASGRRTFEVQVLQPRYAPTTAQLRQMDAYERNRSFKFGYEGSRGSFHSGTKFQDMERTSVDATHRFGFEGDTPYGSTGGHLLFQKAEEKHIITDGQIALRDGSVGPFREFNAYAGDVAVKPNLLALPSVRVRGGMAEHVKEQAPLQWAGFYGREQASLLGTLTPGVVRKRTIDSFVGGGLVDWRPNPDAFVRTGFFSGYGQTRADELNRETMGTQGEFRLNENLTLRPEADFDGEHFAQRHSATMKLGRVQLRQDVRDIPKKFQTLIGAPPRQGELGFRTGLEAGLSERANLSGSLDLFRDRLIPNPEDPDRYNIHRELQLTLAPEERSALVLTYQDIDDTGRIGPTKQRSMGVQYNRHFELWGHDYSVFSRYQNRGNRALANPLLDYVQNQVLVGFRTELFWGVHFSLQKEWNNVEEPNIRRLTHPEAITYAWDYERRLGLTPLYLDVRFRIRDEEETESTNSFMSGEDSTELSFGLYYRETEDLELFLTGGFENFVPESLNVESPRVEARLLTGMRYVFDSGVRWSAVGDFEGSVFKDSNGDGERQPDEQGIEGMTVRTEDGERETVTDADGRWAMEKVAGKRATIVLDSSKFPYGYTPTNSSRRELEIGQGKRVRVDFGLAPRSEITGIVFNDLDGDGQYDLGEPGVRKVKLVLDGAAAAARTNPSGVYFFPDVLAGDHEVALDLGSVPDGYLPRARPKSAVTVYEGVRYELHFPLAAQRAVTGRVFLDKNRSGSLEQGEEALAGIEVRFAGAAVTTDEDGWYLFADVPSGTHALEIEASTLPRGAGTPRAVRLIIGAEPLTLTENLAVPANVQAKTVPAAEGREAAGDSGEAETVTAR